MRMKEEASKEGGGGVQASKTIRDVEIGKDQVCIHECLPIAFYCMSVSECLACPTT
jgi:hypothetical protein